MRWTVRRLTAVVGKVVVCAGFGVVLLAGIHEPYRAWGRPATYSCLRDRATELVPLGAPASGTPPISALVAACTAER